MFSGKRCAPLVGVLLGGCLMTASSGCLWHRTDQGFLFGSQRSAQCSHVPWLRFWSRERVDPGGDSAGYADSFDRPTLSAKQAADRPEVLPWHSRLKNSRLAARLFHGKDADSALLAPEASPPSRSVATGSKAAKKPAEVQFPDHVSPLPEPDRPDLVAE
jgi:hypothetical protein